MFFEYPKLLWLLAVPVLLVLHYLWLELKGRNPHMRVSSLTPWLAAGKSPLAVVRHLPFVLRIGGHGRHRHSPCDGRLQLYAGARLHP